MSLTPAACNSLASIVRITLLGLTVASVAPTQGEPLGPAAAAVLQALERDDPTAAAELWPTLPTLPAKQRRKIVNAATNCVNKASDAQQQRLALATAMLQHPIGMRSTVATWLHLKKGMFHLARNELEQGIAEMHIVRNAPGDYADTLATAYALTAQLNLGRFQAAHAELKTLTRLGGSPTQLAICTAEFWLRCGVLPAAARALAAIAAEPESKNDPLRNWLELEIALENERFTDAATRARELIPNSTGEWRHRFLLIEAVAKERLEAPDASDLLQAIVADQDLPAATRAKALAILANRALRSERPDAAATLLANTESLPQAPLRTVRSRLLAAHHLQGISSRQELVAARDNLATAWQDALTSWREVPLQPDGIAFLQHAPRRELLAAYFECTLALGETDAAEQCLEQWLRADAAASAARRSDLRPASTADVRRHLVPEHGVLLCYLPAPQGSYVLEVDAKGVTAHALRSDRHVRQGVRTLRRAMRPDHRGSADAEPIRTAAAPLRWLLPTTANNIHIAGRELLAAMPFECLPTDDAERPWLGLTTAIGYIPNCALMCRTAAAPQVSAPIDARLTSTVLSAEAAEQAGVANIALDAAELREVLPTDRKLTHVETDAKWTGSMQGLFDAPEHATFHALFAHGVFDGKRATPAGILLADASGNAVPIHAEDAPPRTAHGPADFVLLGVCSAARGSLQRGDDGARHLGGALLQAGARVVALADFDLEVTRLITMSRVLLSSLTAGATPSIALRDARRALHEAGHRSPADWAQLRVEGLTNQPLPIRSQPRTPSTSLGWLAAAASALFLGCLLWFVKNRR